MGLKARIRAAAWTACLSLCAVPACAASEPAVTPRDILGEVRRIVLAVPGEEDFWCDGALYDIAAAQLAAGGRTEAANTASNIENSYRRDEMLFDVAEAWGRAGNRKAALGVLHRMSDPPTRWETDSVLLALVQHKAKSGDLQGGAKTLAEIKSPAIEVRGLIELAERHVGAPRRAERARLLSRAFARAGDVADESERAEAYLLVAKAHLRGGERSAAKAILHRLVKQAGAFRKAWNKVHALREAAALLSRLGDRAGAARLFRQAVRAVPEIGDPCAASNRVGSRRMIAISQADAGLFEDALATVASMPDGRADWTYDGHREEALCRIALAQARAKDVAASVKTAIRIKHFMQYNEDALLGIVPIQVERGELKGALATAKRIKNNSKRAQAKLIVATCHARRGQRDDAIRVASSASFTPQVTGVVFLPLVRTFDCDRPETWGIAYERRGYFTMGSWSITMATAADLAEAAMTYHMTLGGKRTKPFHEAFADFDEGVLRKLAAAQARAGDAGGALRWARGMRSPQQKACALLGVAEGMIGK